MQAAVFPGFDFSVGRGNSFGQKLLAVMLAMTFLWLSYVAQTHIHVQPAKAAATISKAVHTVSDTHSAPSHDGSDGAADCPLCQAVGIGGALIVPFILAFLTLALSVQIVAPIAGTTIGRSWLRHSHQSRGPPDL